MSIKQHQKKLRSSASAGDEAPVSTSPQGSRHVWPYLSLLVCAGFIFREIFAAPVVTEQRLVSMESIRESRSALSPAHAPADAARAPSDAERDAGVVVAPFLFPQLYRCLRGPDQVSKVMEWASQSHEDEWLYTHAFANASFMPEGPWSGTFVELGALDGYTYSNTWFFEKSLDWRGLLIEGQPKNSAQLRRKAATERESVVAVAASICGLPNGPRGGAGVLDFTEGHGAVGAAVKHAAEAFMTGWHSKQPGRVAVACVPLQMLLDRTGLYDIDLFSLDVEGAELAVLETIDFSVTNIRVIIVELDEHDKAQDARVRSLLYNEGFINSPWGSPRVACTGECTANEVFVNPHFADRKAGLGRRWTPTKRALYELGTGVSCGPVTVG
jgi:FkbM family methyltransferase